MMGDADNKTPDSRLYSIEETLQICLQDKLFYEDSGGGVTLSGGEVLTQPKFAIALLKALKKEGIHTAIETSGYAAREIFGEVSALPDMLLFDIKHYSGSRHAEGTGVHNDLILENLKLAIERKTSILSRIPVIPGYNDSKEDACGFAALLTSMGLEQVQLLPFHQFGERKYDLLGIPYEMKNVRQLHKEDLEEFARVIVNAGISCLI